MKIKVFHGYYRKGLIWRGYCIGIPIDADNHVIDDSEFVVASCWAMTRKGIKNRIRKATVDIKKGDLLT